MVGETRFCERGGKRMVENMPYKEPLGIYKNPSVSAPPASDHDPNNLTSVCELNKTTSARYPRLNAGVVFSCALVRTTASLRPSADPLRNMIVRKPRKIDE